MQFSCHEWPELELLRLGVTLENATWPACGGRHFTPIFLHAEVQEMSPVFFFRSRGGLSSSKNIGAKQGPAPQPSLSWESPVSATAGPEILAVADRHPANSIGVPAVIVRLRDDGDRG